MIKRSVPALLIALLIPIAGCATLPAGPEPIKSDYIPQFTPDPADFRGALSPDGFGQAQRMTVRIRNIGCEGLSTGTGFAIDEYTLVTNRHVIDNSNRLQVTTYDGKTISVKAAAATTVADLAIVTIDEPLGVEGLLAQEDPENGDAVTVVGYPRGGRLTTVSGVILGTTTDPLGAALGKVYASTAPVEPGSSGSPVLNEDGQVVGVVYAKNESEQSFIVPVSMLRTLLQEPSLLVPQQQNCVRPQRP